MEIRYYQPEVRHKLKKTQENSSSRPEDEGHYTNPPESVIDSALAINGSVRKDMRIDVADLTICIEHAG
jgi:hypothetical protein